MVQSYGCVCGSTGARSYGVLPWNLPLFPTRKEREPRPVSQDYVPAPTDPPSGGWQPYLVAGVVVVVAAAVVASRRRR